MISRPLQFLIERKFQELCLEFIQVTDEEGRMLIQFPLDPGTLATQNNTSGTTTSIWSENTLAIGFQSCAEQVNMI